MKKTNKHLEMEIEDLKCTIGMLRDQAAILKGEISDRHLEF